VLWDAESVYPDSMVMTVGEKRTKNPSEENRETKPGQIRDMTIANHLKTISVSALMD